jgi:hypothetical protein
MTPVLTLTAAMTMPSATAFIAFATRCICRVYVPSGPLRRRAKVLAGEQLLQESDMPGASGRGLYRARYISKFETVLTSA